MTQAKKRGNSHFSHFGLEANLLQELEEAFLVRSELEGLATEVAATKMTPELLEELDAAEKAFSKISVELRPGPLRTATNSHP